MGGKASLLDLLIPPPCRRLDVGQAWYRIRMGMLVIDGFGDESWTDVGRKLRRLDPRRYAIVLASALLMVQAYEDPAGAARAQAGVEISESADDTSAD